MKPQLRISLETFAVEGDGRLSGSEGISEEAGENMDHGVHGRPMARMLKAHLRLEGIKDGFDDEALAQHDLVSYGHQVVPHVAADTRNEVQTALPECLEQVLTDIAFVGVELARQVSGHLIQHGAVGGDAGGDFNGHDLA